MIEIVGIKTLTNADRIRGMDDEELAEFLCHMIEKTMDYDIDLPCDGCCGSKYCHVGHRGLIDWLQEEVEE